jgi:DNA-binding transcriptional MocR family regulator
MHVAAEENQPSTIRLSYKFQRLRERLRQAIASGELAGKLPGERELARRFNANPKTLSKALTDLAGEGLLDRSIGRGTYVKGHERPGRRPPRWMILCGQRGPAAPLLGHLLAANPDAHVIVDPASLRPSFIRQFDTVLDLDPDTP